MNAARIRRGIIRARARTGRLKRLKREEKMKCKHDILRNVMFCEKCNPTRFKPSETVRASVYLDDEFSALGKTKYVNVDLPLDTAGTTVQQMYTRGFWTYQDFGDERAVFFIPPFKINRIMIWEENRV